MAFHKEKKYAQKHQRKVMVDPVTERTVLQWAKEGEISCIKAFDIAKQLSVPVASIGTTMDLLDIKLTKCQLGLFGHKPAKKLFKPLDQADPEVKDAISKALTNGRLSCKDAWDISSRCNVTKITVSSTCELLGIKINHCQLGAF